MGLAKKIAVVGATGAVGRCFVELLLTRVAADCLSLYASARSHGTVIGISGHEFTVYDVASTDFNNIDLVFFSAGSEVAKAHAPRAEASGAWVIDNSSAFRDTRPLVVPEINLLAVTGPGIIANPNCTVIPLTLTLNALKACAITSASVVTFQSVSGSGNKGIQALLKGGVSEVYGAPIAGNVIPKIDSYLDNGFTKEEMKLTTETKKILQWDIAVAATAVRVPVMQGHSLAVHLHANKPWDMSLVRQSLKQHPGIKIVPDEDILTPKTHLEFCPGVMISRLRLEPGNDFGLLYWLVSDNLQKGAALNSVQIAEHLGLIKEPAYV